MRRSSTLLCAVIAITAILFSGCSAQDVPVEITHHSDVTYVTGVAKYLDYVFCATKGGLVRWEIPEGKYAVYTTNDGLPTNVLTDVVVDGDGIMWIGTVDGIVSFDGSYFKVYDESDGLPSREINDVAVDRSGNLWVGTKKGAASYSNGKFTFLNDEHGPGDFEIRCIYFDLADNIWLGTNDKGLYGRTDGTWYRGGSREGLLKNTIVTIVQAWDRSMWASSWVGISRFDGVGWKTFSSMKKFGTYDGRYLYSTESRLWFFTDNGVHASQGADWYHYTEELGLISNDVTCGQVISDDEVYVGTIDGLSVIRDEKIESYFIPSSPVGHNTLSVTVDSKDRIWLGTWDDGLNMYDSGFWTQLLGPDFDSLNSVRSIVFGEDGGTVFNTTDGIVFEKDNTWTTETRRQGVSGDDVRCGVYDKEGRYWVGTSSGICYRDTKGKWKRYRSLHGLPSEDSWACALDADGTVWFGTSMGIVSFTDGVLNDRTEEAGLGEIDVRSVAFDGTRMLFGTNDGKLIEFADGSWDSFGANYLNTDKGIFDIEIAADGVVWLATNGDGVIGLNNGSSSHFTVHDGLPSSFVKSLAFAGDDLWAACYGGLVKIEFLPAE